MEVSALSPVVCNTMRLPLPLPGLLFLGRWGGCSVAWGIFGLRGFSFRGFFGDRTISEPLRTFISSRLK